MPGSGNAVIDADEDSNLYQECSKLKTLSAENNQDRRWDIPNDMRAKRLYRIESEGRL